jgi:paxillin
MGGKWHQECFVCEVSSLLFCLHTVLMYQECGNGFANSLFFPRDGKAFCTECYGVMVGA